MTYEDFQLLLIEHEIDTDPYLPFSLDSLYRYAREKPKTKDKEPILVQYWSTGGVSGGSCWDSSDPQPYTSNEGPPLAFESLDKLLMAVCPTISFLQYRVLSGKVIESGEETEYEYYGNCTCYAYQLVRVKRLYEELVAMGLISPA